MKNKKLIILFLITLAVIVAAGITAKMRAPQKTVEKVALFPDLANRVNDVSRIAIKEHNRTVELTLQGGNWVIASSDNYPALLNKVRAAVINMADLKIVDEKTDNPELYSRLGVEAPEHEDSTSLLITLYDTNNQNIADLIIGNQRQSAGSKPGLYVRKPDTKTALLVEGVLDISASQSDWFQRDLFDIPSNRVSSVEIKYPEGNKFEIFKETPEQADYQIRGDTEEEITGKSAVSIILNRLANGLQEIRVDGVVSADNFTLPEDTITTSATTFDGLIINAKLAMVDEKAYANFTFTSDPERITQYEKAVANIATEANADSGDQQIDINELAQSMNAALSGWVYVIPDFKYEALTTSPDSLKKLLKQMPDK